MILYLLNGIPKLTVKGTAIPITPEDIRKLEDCGFTYDKERNMMIKLQDNG